MAEKIGTSAIAVLALVFSITSWVIEEGERKELAKRQVESAKQQARSSEAVKDLQKKWNQIIEREDAVKVSWSPDGGTPDWPKAIVVQNYAPSPVNLAVLTFRSTHLVPPDQYLRIGYIQPCRRITFTFKDVEARQVVHNTNNTAFIYNIDGQFWIRDGTSFSTAESQPNIESMKNLEPLVVTKTDNIQDCHG